MLFWGHHLISQGRPLRPEGWSQNSKQSSALFHFHIAGSVPGSQGPVSAACRELPSTSQIPTSNWIRTLFPLLRPLSKSPSRKREDLHDNAMRTGREIYCWLEPGPLLQPTQWCKVREPRAPVSTHIYRVLDFKHKQWVVGASGLVTCLQSNFIGTNVRDFPGKLPGGFTGRVLVSWSLVAYWGQIITPPSGETET